MAFTDVEAASGGRSYSLWDYLGEINAVVLYTTVGDKVTFTLLQRSNGRRVELPAEPKVAPDRQRLVTADFCADPCVNELAVWRITPKGVGRELVWKPAGPGRTRSRPGRTTTRCASSTRRPARANRRRSNANSTTPAGRARARPLTAAATQPAARPRGAAMAQTRCDTGRCAVSSCGRGECRRRSSARSTNCCRATAFPSRRRSSTSTAYSVAAPRASSRSAAAWAKRRRRSLRRGPREDFLGVEVHAPGRRQPAEADRRAGLVQRADRSATTRSTSSRQ